MLGLGDWVSGMVSGEGRMGPGRDTSSSQRRESSTLCPGGPQAHFLSQAYSTEKGGGSSYPLSLCASGREPSLQVWKEGKLVLLHGLRCG